MNEYLDKYSEEFVWLLVTGNSICQHLLSMFITRQKVLVVYHLQAHKEVMVIFKVYEHYFLDVTANLLIKCSEHKQQYTSVYICINIKNKKYLIWSDGSHIVR